MFVGTDTSTYDQGLVSVAEEAMARVSSPMANFPGGFHTTSLPHSAKDNAGRRQNPTDRDPPALDP